MALGKLMCSNCSTANSIKSNFCRTCGKELLQEREELTMIGVEKSQTKTSEQETEISPIYPKKLEPVTEASNTGLYAVIIIIFIILICLTYNNVTRDNNNEIKELTFNELSKSDRESDIKAKIMYDIETSHNILFENYNLLSHCEVITGNSPNANTLNYDYYPNTKSYTANFSLIIKSAKKYVYSNSKIGVPIEYHLNYIFDTAGIRKGIQATIISSIGGKIKKTVIDTNSNYDMRDIINMEVVAYHETLYKRKKEAEEKKLAAERIESKRISKIEEQERRSRESQTNNALPDNDNSIDLNKFTGQKFTFKSTTNDKELNGIILQTNDETTYHTFDFVSKTVTMKAPLNGKWITITFPINGVYQEKGLLASTFVIVVNTLGIKEIWFSADVPNLGYDYDDGTRIACYNITKIN
jgi:hypothetical protein